jgi:hypothetical protein
VEYKNSLEFKHEYQLTAEPLRVDLLIIKKPSDLVIDKNIARLFKSDNIVEFKSPDDYLSVKDFLKVYAYACLYAATTPGVEFSGVTLTFVGRRHPREFIRYLRGERGYGVGETGPGIYTVSGDYLPIQLIETKRLPAGENLWLKSLERDLESGVASAIVEAGKTAAREAPMSAYLDVLLRANPRAFMEAWTMANSTETFEEVFTEAGIIPQWIERGIEVTEAKYKSVLEEKNREIEELRRKLREVSTDS